jgi:1-acyl-sn-glycerol-3-phosphate acyltransferase
VATVLGNLFLVLGTAVFATLSLVASFVPPRGRLMFHVARGWARGLLWSSLLRVEVERERPLAAGERYVFLANHQSLFDIPAMLVAVPGQTRFLAKASLFRIPVFGWALRIGGFVPVDRRDRSNARKSFASALDRLRHGASILIFPEETRSLDGRVQPFRKGGLLLALKSGMPAVPVGIEGTFEVQKRTSFVIRPRTLRVRFGAPVALAEESVRKLPELGEALRGTVAELARTTIGE